MFYNRILRVWVVDALDYFLLSALIGSILASSLRNYLSEKRAMERLKNFIIKKSKLISKLEKPPSITNYKKLRIQKIYRFALGNCGGQFENFQADHVFFNEVFKLTQEIKGIIERLAIFLKERELQGVAKIFFKNGRLLLELLLYKFRIDITYSVLTERLSTQVIVLTATAGGAAGFTFSWFSAGISLVASTVILSILLIQNVAQQILNQRDYSKFKKMVVKILEDDEIKETLRAVFMEG